MYKLPKQAQHENEYIKTGLGFVYITSDYATKEWTISSASINNSHSMLGYTLAPLYQKVSLN